MISPSPSCPAPPLPCLRKQGEATQLLVDGNPYLVLGGEIHNSSASDLAYMEANVWDKLVGHHCNTILAPVYWELLEPEEGRFDFSLVDGLLDGARKRGLRVVILWFATWKNGMSTYAPAWVKTDLARFPRMECEAGRPCGAISPFGGDTLAADARAFRALMRYLRIHDEAHRTVIMMQVENEPGLLGASRDRTALATEIFQSPIPDELHAALKKRKAVGGLRPELRHISLDTDTPLSWLQTFGPAADEVLMAWFIGRFINHVAREGREEYLLPCYANSWLVQFPGQKPGDYPSGGPVSRMMDIWQIAGPDLFALAPDIYLNSFAGVCADYADQGNPLFIPEAGNRRQECSAHTLYSIGRHDALGLAPFGIDSLDDPLLAETNRLLAGLAPLITAAQGTGRIAAVLQGGSSANGLGPAPGINTSDMEVLEFQNYRIEFSYHFPLQTDNPPAAALLIEETPDTFVIVGLGGIDVNFYGKDPGPGGDVCKVGFLRLEEGEYQAGSWQPGRRLNGDEYVVRLGLKPSIYRAMYYRYG